MAYYIFEKTQRLPIDMETAWQYFSSPANLKDITPPYMKMTQLSGFESKMFPGQIITYKVSPVAGIPINWMTEIKHVSNQHYFIDEQRFGPYALWHHLHTFKAVSGGIEMSDIVNYKLPLGFLGTIAHTLFVKKQIHQIFNYRYQRLEKIFGKM
ncbi:MAG: SRPBCC family protein [Chitinophagales bacterium]